MNCHCQGTDDGRDPGERKSHWSRGFLLGLLCASWEPISVERSISGKANLWDMRRQAETETC